MEIRNSEVTLFPGFSAMSIAASKVSAGAVPPGGVAAVNRALHATEVLPPKLLLTHAARMFARVSISVEGKTTPGKLLAGRPAPEAVSVRRREDAREPSMPTCFVGDVPTETPSTEILAKGAKA